jgi:hypothetical protein
MINETDKIIQQLFEVVQQKKAEIAKAEKPNWLTNCAFRFNLESSSSINLQVCSEIETLINILGFLCEKKRGHDEAISLLGLSSTFKWLNFTFDEWCSDIKTRIDKINISAKRKELEILESRLDNLVSPELKRKLELEEIQKLLKG